MAGLTAVSFLLSALLALALAAGASAWAWAALALAGLAWLLRAAGRRAARRGGSADWLIPLLVANLLLLAPELSLRLAGFRFEPGIQFGYPRPSQFVPYEQDPLLFWKLREPPASARVSGPPGPGVRRIVFLGDSVTQQGYPDLLCALLNGAPADGRRAECVNLAVSGYSSHQGRLLAGSRAAALAPADAVVLFVWNDHWLARGAIDAQKKGAAEPAGAARLLARARRASRLIQAMAWLRARGAAASAAPLELPRVPPDQSEGNLVAIARDLQAAGARVLLVTAPSAHAALGVPPYLLENGLARDAASVLALHREYNEIVRRAARATGAALADLESEWSRMPPEVQRTIFLEDGIHLTPAGLTLIASSLERSLR